MISNKIKMIKNEIEKKEKELAILNDHKSYGTASHVETRIYYLKEYLLDLQNESQESNKRVYNALETIGGY